MLWIESYNGAMLSMESYKLTTLWCEEKAITKQRYDVNRKL